MENKKEYPMTQAGYDLEELKTVRRPDVVEKIKVARSFGDLSENSEYDAAKDEQGFVEKEITKIEEMIRHAVIIEDTGDNNTVALGKTVTFKEIPDGEEESSEVQKLIRLKVKFQMNLQWLNHCLVLNLKMKLKFLYRTAAI